MGFYRCFRKCGKIGNLRAQTDFRQQNRRSRKSKTGVWSADLGFSPHFRNRPMEVCGKSRTLEHWQKIRTNNVQQRANREIKRRYRSVQSFPSEASMMRLVCAVLAGEEGGWAAPGSLRPSRPRARPPRPRNRLFLIAFIFRKSRDKSFGFHDDCFAS